MAVFAIKNTRCTIVYLCNIKKNEARRQGCHDGIIKPYYGHRMHKWNACICEHYGDKGENLDNDEMDECNTCL